MHENKNEYVDINAHNNYPDSDQKIEIPTMKVIPLKKICMTIGQLPTAYLETLSYYEMLVWFIEYLKNNIIPTINNNASAVQEVQSVVIELQNYINNYKDSIDSDVEELEEYMNNYFENLDVQEEINNKLDQMLENGILEQIIEQFLQSTALWCFDNVADMKLATNLINGSYVKTLGYYSVNDGGSASYKIRTKESGEVANETTLISVNNTNLLAELILDKDINILKCGAKNDGTSDCSNLINSLITEYPDYNIFLPNGTYLLNSSIELGTATKIYGENKWKTILTTNNEIIMIKNKSDDIATCTISNLYIDGNNHGTKGIYLYRNRPNLVYNDSRSFINNICIKKCTDWCFQIGDPNASSNVIEIVVDDIYVHEYTGGGIYISRCSDSHFSNLRSGSGLTSTKPAIQVEGYNLQIINSKAFLSGTTEAPLSGWVFNGGANIIAEIEAQANTKHGVEIKNTKDSSFNIISDKNSLSSENYAGILIDSVQNCTINGIVSNNVLAEGFNTTTGCKLVEPKKLTLNLSCNNDITNALDLSSYNVNQVLTVNSKININGYEKQDITPEFNSEISLPEGITLTKINNESYLLQGSVTNDTNIWLAGSYGSHTTLTYIHSDKIYELNTNNFKVGMVLWNYVTNLGGGYDRKINGINSEVTAIALQLKANINYNHIITPKIISILNKKDDSI